MLAVNDFRGEGIDASAARIITDRIRSELVTSGHVRVIERSEMDNILREQGFQQTGVCDDERCLIEVGQVLGVGHILAGTIGKLGNLYTISMRLINVGTAEIIATVAEDCRCNIEDIPSTAAPSIVRKLFARLAPGDSISLVGLPVGVLRVTSTPSSARLSLDGSVAGSTPFENQSMSIGKHFLRLELDGYLPREDAIIIESKAPLALVYELSPIASSNAARHGHTGKVIRILTLGAGTIVFATAGYTMNVKARKSYDIYRNIPSDASTPEFNDAWNTTAKFMKNRNVAYALSGLCLIGCSVSIVF